MKFEVLNLCKSIKGNTILENINIVFESGKIYGITGRNGCGKSVFFKVLTGLYAYDNGKILLNGKEIDLKKEYIDELGVLIENPKFLGYLTGFENLVLLSKIKNKIKKEDILKALEIVNLEEYDKKYNKYSLGMKQKLGIAQAIMEYPEIIILDEPFNGIEDITVIKIKKYLLKLKDEGKIIILSSHIKDDLFDICDLIYEFSDKTSKEIKYGKNNI